MTWLAVMMTLSCRVLARDEHWLARAERIETRRLTQCVEGSGGDACRKYAEALTDIHERMEARTQAWVAKECGGPMENT